MDCFQLHCVSPTHRKPSGNQQTQEDVGVAREKENNKGTASSNRGGGKGIEMLIFDVVCLLLLILCLVSANLMYCVSDVLWFAVCYKCVFLCLI